MDNLKESVCNALATWIRQRPGLEFGNYGDVASYRAELRSIARDKRDAETLLAAVRWRESITGQDIIEAARHAYSGRMTINITQAWDGTRNYFPVRIDYCTGQYWPTEYRRAAAAVLASALWSYARDNMPAPAGYRVECLADTNADGSPGGYVPATRREFPTAADAESYAQTVNARRYPSVHAVYSEQRMRAGDYLRRRFRAEFGSAIQRRWFN